VLIEICHLEYGALQIGKYLLTFEEVCRRHLQGSSLFLLEDALPKIG
jgi:hypothetical protein